MTSCYLKSGESFLIKLLLIWNKGVCTVGVVPSLLFQPWACLWCLQLGQPFCNHEAASMQGRPDQLQMFHSQLSWTAKWTPIIICLYMSLLYLCLLTWRMEYIAIGIILSELTLPVSPTMCDPSPCDTGPVMWFTLINGTNDASRCLHLCIGLTLLECCHHVRKSAGHCCWAGNQMPTSECGHLAYSAA